ncbi:uncharacterized protein LOC130999382 isoform X1 [Salvia miltiorrhiza]|uniref:uncharacterized protein LOC130999382 isoform X1 n=1 Tax=Salvia miltiorrhiza TaxID=226208 RepID=UPI0025AC58A2|nr:uncharacterized protein LOC130999382 isoform X1 [Salvia miltiorrhiza]XP_057780897.1 uncharacterized protein LOC130999382 isoform X1 [Salvia miltiorrhiza]
MREMARNEGIQAHCSCALQRYSCVLAKLSRRESHRARLSVPCPLLQAVGYQIRQDACNGDTKVPINAQEITTIQYSLYAALSWLLLSINTATGRVSLQLPENAKKILKAIGEILKGNSSSVNLMKTP